MNGSSEKNLMMLFESSIRNPLDDKTGQSYFDEFSKCTKDKLSEVNVLQYEGEKPIGIDFEMEYALPADVYEYARGA